MTYSAEVLADSPLAYWRLGEASGLTTVDSSGNGKNGTYGGIIQHTTGLLVGDSDTCVDFNGTNTQSDTPAFTGAADPSSAMSVEALISLDALNKKQVIHARANESGTNRKNFMFFVDATNHASFTVWLSNTTACTATDTATLASGTTYHVVGTFDGSNVRLYVNGTLVATTPAAGSMTQFGIGLGGIIGTGYNGTNYARFDGKIDEVAYYGTALSSTRVAAHYAATGLSGSALAGEAFAASATMLDGTPRTAIRVSGEPFASGATMLDGGGFPIRVTGEAFLAAATMLDGSPLVQLIIHGEPFTSAATMLQGGVFGAAVAGDAFAVGAVMLDGFVVFDTDTTNALDGLDLLLAADVIFTTPVATPPAPLPERYDVAVPYPVPVLNGGRVE